MEQPERITELLQQIQEHTATPADCDELLRLIKNDTSGIVIRAITAYHQEYLHLHASEQTAAPVDWPAAAREVLQVTKTMKGSATPVRSISSRKWWWAVAAMLAGILLVAGYLFLNKPQNSSGPSAVINSITPGGNKAVLTLADGTAIPLDSAGSQTIQQGATSVLQEGGRLQYVAHRSDGVVSYNTLTTPLGGQYQVVLPDGSRVWLNAGSSLRYSTAFTGTGREVELSGEAYFEISRNPLMPFRVQVQNMMVQVLGTHFNISAYADEQSIRTTLLEGSVRVAKDKESRLLSPGQQAVLSSDTKKIIVHNNVNVEAVIAWKNGLFQFEETDLHETMRQIARWYDVEVVYEGKFPPLQFYGQIQRELSIAEVLRILEKSGVRFRVDGRKIIVQPDMPK